MVSIIFFSLLGGLLFILGAFIMLCGVAYGQQPQSSFLGVLIVCLVGFSITLGATFMLDRQKVNYKALSGQETGQVKCVNTRN